MTLRGLVMIAGLWSAVWAEAQTSRAASPYTGEAKLTPDSPELFRARLELELRRAGGPRGERTAGLLMEGLTLNASDWGRLALESCRNGSADCGELADAGEQWLLGKRPPADVITSEQVMLLRREAWLHMLTPRERRRIYTTALSEGEAHADGATLGGFEAARRALEENVNGMGPLIDKAVLRWPATSKVALKPYEDLGGALASSDHFSALLKLVKAGASVEVGFLSGALNQGAGKAPRPPVASEQSARLALRELRREGTVEAVAQLKEIFAAYDAVRVAVRLTNEERIRQGQATGRPPLASDLYPANWYLSGLGREIINAIGDLGDREFERATLGERSLWDQVNEAETRLVREGRLRQSEMVSR